MPVNNVSLMGPNPAQSFDLQTQQAQLLQAQKIAEMLIGQGMEGGGSPVIRTAPGNPFARDVANWQGPLSAAIKSAVGQMKLGGVNEQQMELANQAIAQREEGMADMGAAMQSRPPTLGTQFGDQGGPGDALANPTPDRLAMTDPGQQGGFLAGIMSGLNAKSPEVRALANAWLGKRMDIAGKMGLGSSELAAFMRAQGDTRSIPQSFSKDELTGAMIPTSPEKVAMVPSVQKLSPGEIGIPTVLGGATAGAVGAPLTNKVDGKMYGPGERMPDGSVNDTGQTVTLNPAGKPEIVDEGSARTAATKAVAADQIKSLSEGKHATQEFTKSIPALKDLINLTDLAQTGWGANQIVDVRRALKQLGVSDDTLGKVTNTQTMVKYAMPEAIASGRALSARITQQEFNQFLANYGADPAADAATLKTIFRKAMINGLNEAKVHEDNVRSAAGTHTLGKSAETYRVQLPAEEEIFSGIHSGFKFEKGPSGIWKDALVAPKKEMVTKPYSGGTAYQGLKNPGKWYTTQQEAEAN